MKLRINWTAITVAVFLGVVVKVNSANDANGEPEECCPPPTEWEMVSCPGLVNTPSIAPLAFCATAGDSVCMPDIVLPIYSEGQKKRYKDIPCECIPEMETAAITFTVESKWEPELPAKLSVTFSSTLWVEVTSSDPSLCHAPDERLPLGPVTWTVNPMPISVGAVNWLPDGVTSTEGWGPCKMGETKHTLSYDIGVYSHCGDTVWRVNLTKFDAQILQHVRLLPGPPTSELTSSMITGTTDCEVLNRMKVDLIIFLNGGGCDALYGVLAAVQAHEDVHKAHTINAINDAFSEFKAAVEEPGEQTSCQ